MKRTTRFITLVLTLILALSCSMQIFAEEIAPHALCLHKTKLIVPQSVTKESETPDPEMQCKYVTYCYDAEWCTQCNKSFIIQGTETYVSERYEHLWEPGTDGKIYCYYCWRPKNP